MIMNPAARILLPALAAFAAGGCASFNKYASNPKNPFPDIRTVAVLPVMDQTGAMLRPELLEEMGNTLASELASFPGFAVIRPQKLAALAREKRMPAPARLQDAVDLARAAGADAALVASVTEWKGYPPPRLGLAVEFLRTQAWHLESRDIDRWTQTGRPFVVERDQAGHVLAALERVVDSHHSGWRGEIETFADAHSDKDLAFPDGAQFVLVDRYFFQFASNWMLREIVAMHAAPPAPAGGLARR
jgi:hypothetical protein